MAVKTPPTKCMMCKQDIFNRESSAKYCLRCTEMVKFIQTYCRAYVYRVTEREFEKLKQYLKKYINKVVKNNK